jgi:uncharacterized repeat protein (TIGR01451 family)
MRFRGLVAAGLLAVLAACESPSGPAPSAPREEPVASDLTIGPVASSLNAAPGERITVAVRWHGEGQLAAVQGTLAWDPLALRYLGQIASAGSIVAAGPRGPAALEVAALNPSGLSAEPAAFAFEVLSDRYAARLTFAPSVAADSEARRLSAQAAVVAVEPSLPAASLARTMDWPAWLEVLGWPEGRPTEPARVPGSGTIFGDATQDGTINVLDALATSLRSVGLEEIIVGTDAPDEDVVVAANVSPLNLPGRGETGDTCAPGIDVCGTIQRTINVLDALLISLESVGTDQPAVGELIPRASAVGSRVLTGSLTATRVLSPDTTYQVQGTILIDAGGALIAPPGTRIGGTAGALIVVGRNGRIEARGTHLDPVVMTCDGGQEVRGCWAGVVLAGNAPINRGSPTSPSAPGNGQSGCLQVLDDPRVGSYGGCDPNDDRGILSYVRIEFATRGLELLGVGRGTLIDQLQVHGAQSAGVTVGGGAADLRHVLITATLGDGLSWRDGWIGRTQFVIVQLDPVSGASGLVGRNALGNPSAVPFSRPTLFNTTVVGVDFPPAGAAVKLLDGTGGIIRNLVGVGLPDPGSGIPNGLDIDGAVTCTRIGADLSLETSVFAGIDFPGDPDIDVGCASSPLVEDGVLAVGLNSIVTGQAAIATLIKSATDPFLPDFRGTWTGALGAFTATTPPNDGFFDASAAYAGGSGVATPAQPNIPWYSGWTRGGLGISGAFGGIQGIVRDGVTPLLGVAVVAAAGDVADVTDAAGSYALAFVRPGAMTLSLANVPVDCVDPGFIPVSVMAGNVTTLDIVLACGGADVAVTKTGPGVALAGDTIEYVIAATNNGPSDASGVVVTDSLPSGMTLVSASRSGSVAGGVVTWPPVSLTNGQAVVDTVRAIVPATSGTGVNIAAATSTTPDPDPSNNDGSDSASRVSTAFQASADLAVSKTGPANALVSDTLIYVITTTNSGPSAAQNVVVADTLPPGLSFLSATRGATQAVGVATWPAVSLASGASLVDSLVVVATSVGNRFDIAAVTASTPDPILANNVDSLTTFVGPLSTGLIWESEFADEAIATPVAIGGVVVSMTGADPSGVGRASNFTVEHDALGTHTGFWVVDIDATSPAQAVTFALMFSEAVDSLRFTLLDVDRRVTSPQFQDSVAVVGWNGTTAFAPTVEGIGSEVHESSPGAFAGETEVTGATAANVSLFFAQPVDSVTFVYGPGPLSPANPAQQTIGLSDLTWSVAVLSGSPAPLPPPVAGGPVARGAPPLEGPEDR